MMMPGITEWLIILAVVALIFGTSKLKNVGRDLGGAIADFKSGLKDSGEEEQEDEKTEKAPAAPAASAEDKSEEKVAEKAAK